MLCRVEALEIMGHKGCRRVVAGRYAISNALADIHAIAAAFCKAHEAAGYAIRNLHTDEIVEVWPPEAIESGSSWRTQRRVEIGTPVWLNYPRSRRPGGFENGGLSEKNRGGSFCRVPGRPWPPPGGNLFGGVRF